MARAQCISEKVARDEVREVRATQVSFLGHHGLPLALLRDGDALVPSRIAPSCCSKKGSV